jgi:hypothetical protein
MRTRPPSADSSTVGRRRRGLADEAAHEVVALLGQLVQPPVRGGQHQADVLARARFVSQAVVERLLLVEVALDVGARARRRLAVGRPGARRRPARASREVVAETGLDVEAALLEPRTPRLASTIQPRP